MKHIIFALLLTSSIIAQHNLKIAKIESILSIGDNENLSSYYIFANPYGISLDSIGNIYVAEKMEMAIRKYSPTGAYIKSIGRRGRGPGEFLDYSLFFIDDDTLKVFDMINTRYTMLSKEGHLLNSKNFSFEKILWPKGIIKMKNSFVLLQDLQYKEDLFFVINSKQDSVLNSFGREFYPQNNIEKALFSFFKSDIVKVSNTEFLYSPSFYSGQIHSFQESNGEWKIKNTINGFIEEKDAYIGIDSQVNNKDVYTFRAYIDGNKVTAKLNNESRGLFLMSNGNLIHFTLLKIDNMRVFGCEVFDKQFNFLDYYKIYSQKIQGQIAVDIPIIVHAIDKDDNFYWIENFEFPIVKKVKLFFE